MADTVDSNDGWTVGSAKVGRAAARVAFALSLFGLGGAAGVAVDVFHLPSLLGATMDARAALCRVAWAGTALSIGLVPLLARLLRAADHTGGGEVKE